MTIQQSLRGLAAKVTGMDPGDIDARTIAKVIQFLTDHYPEDGTGTGEFTESDPTVPDWAKQPARPSYTAEEVGALPVTTSIPSGDALLVGAKAAAISPLAEDASLEDLTKAFNDLAAMLSTRGVTA